MFHRQVSVTVAPTAQGTASMVACAALALAACGSGGGGAGPLPPTSDVSEIRRLNLGEFFLAARPASCERTKAVLLIANKPQPRELGLREGDCLMWGNTASDSAVTARYTRQTLRALPAPRMDLSVRLPPRFASTPRGPVDALPRGEAFTATGGGTSPFSFNSERATFAFSPDRPRPRRLRCPSRALRGPAADTPLTVAYTIQPGGAKGTLVLDRSARIPKPPARQVPRGLGKVASLTCGELTIAERPAGCTTTRAVLIVARKPVPSELRLPRAGGCVVWGNNDGSEATLTITTDSSADTAANRRTLWPRAAVAWDFFFRSSPGEVAYRIEPGGAAGTIVLE